jgi:hypothetical protein
MPRPATHRVDMRPGSTPDPGLLTACTKAPVPDRWLQAMGALPLTPRPASARRDEKGSSVLELSRHPRRQLHFDPAAANAAKALGFVHQARLAALGTERTKPCGGGSGRRRLIDRLRNQSLSRDEKSGPNLYGAFGVKRISWCAPPLLLPSLFSVTIRNDPAGYALAITALGDGGPADRPPIRGEPRHSA